MEINITHKIPEQKLEFLLDSAGRGSSYWCENGLQLQSEVKKIMSGGHSLITDIETDSPAEQTYLLTLDMIRVGLKTMALKQPQEFADILTDDYDNNTGDAFLQYCLFGELIYQ